MSSGFSEKSKERPHGGVLVQSGNKEKKDFSHTPKSLHPSHQGLLQQEIK